MNNHPNANRSNDIIHSVLLLIFVPLVFYGGYYLVSQTTEDTLEPTQPLKTIGELSETIKSTTSRFTGPPPGDTWLKQVDSLKTQIQLAQVPIADLEKKRQIEESLNLIRQHVEANVHEMPGTVSVNSPLGKQINHIANQIESFQNSKLAMRQLSDWKTQYEIARRQRDTEVQSRIAAELRDQLAPLSRTHQAELGDLTRRSQNLANQLQLYRNKAKSIESSNRDVIAKERRLQEFLRDKADIDLLLKPFTTPASFQLGTGYTDWRKVSEQQPISYSRLESSGALDNSINGVRSMLYIGRPAYGTKQYGSRPLGSFPQDIKSTANMEKVKRAQSLIRKHSVYLIESGLLNP